MQKVWEVCKRTFLTMKETKYKAWYGGVMFQSIVTDDEGWIFVDIDDLDKTIEEQLWYPSNIIFADKRAVKRQYTGFKDAKGIEIYDGDILGEWVETDEGKIFARHQVFWSEKHGVWYIDNSFDQDKSYSDYLWLSLKDFNYEVCGNIYEKKNNPNTSDASAK